MNYYNEYDRKTAAWLRALIDQGSIPPGEVDERSITDVEPTDLVGYTQCHFFAGIGGWSEALRLAGWPADQPVWTGSCPCQPFSTGANDSAQGTGDKRDLWPCFYELISQRKPTRVIGEQIKNSISWGWYDRAKMDLEKSGYAVAAAILRSDAFGAFHQRKRLYWVGDTCGQGRKGFIQERSLSCRSVAALRQHGDPIARARLALAGDFGDLLLRNGVSVGMERSRIHGYGNAIMPQVAAEFIKAAL